MCIDLKDKCLIWDYQIIMSEFIRNKELEACDGNSQQEIFLFIYIFRLLQVFLPVMGFKTKK